MFTTVGVERLGIPKVRLTDGPNGARGVNGDVFAGALGAASIRERPTGFVPDHSDMLGRREPG